jgi:hypothetical protein
MGFLGQQTFEKATNLFLGYKKQASTLKICWRIQKIEGIEMYRRSI